MSRRIVAPLLVVLVVAAVASIAAPAARSHPVEKTRIGTVRRVDVMVAWYRSAPHDAVIRDLIRQRDEAKAKGETQAAAAIEARGAAMQDRAHRQLEGAETIPEIIAGLAPSFPDVARETGVVAIAETVPYHDADAVEIVDVTDALVRRLPPVSGKK